MPLTLTQLTTSSHDLNSNTLADLQPAARLANAILKTSDSFTSKAQALVLATKLRSVLGKWDKKTLLRLENKGWNTTNDVSTLLMPDSHKTIFEEIGIKDVLAEPGDTEILEHVAPTDSPATKLRIINNSLSSASPYRKLQILAEAARRDARIAEAAKLRDHQREVSQQRETRARNTLLQGLLTKIDHGMESDQTQLEVKLTPQEKRTEIFPQNQLDLLVTTIAATENCLGIGAEDAVRPKLTMAQTSALDFLRVMRKRNLETFAAVRNLVNAHVESNCTLSSNGVLTHGSNCPDMNADGASLTQLFVRCMSELQPPLRHAILAMFNRKVSNIKVDYLWASTRTQVDLWHPRSQNNASWTSTETSGLKKKNQKGQASQ